jgi:glutathione-regulated potassium-efflux system protein KefB
MLMKATGIYLVARFLRSGHAQALQRAVIMAQGGEFAFVLYSSALAVGIINGQENAILTAVIILSMVLTPLAMIGLRYALPREEQALDGVDVAEDLDGSVLVIGFGRFGQIASQPLLLKGIDVSIIDNDVEMIQAAATFGFKVYYGDGTRLDILNTAGAGRARAVLICVDKGEIAVRIAEHMRAEYPLVPVLARAFDRGIAMDLIQAGVDYQIRETFESALSFGQATLEKLGIDRDEALETIEDVRQRDAARLDAQLVGGLQAGRQFMKGNMPVPAPLTPPRRPGRPANEETASMLEQTAARQGDVE